MVDGGGDDVGGDVGGAWSRRSGWSGKVCVNIQRITNHAQPLECGRVKALTSTVPR